MRVVIAGGGMSGLLASYVVRLHQVEQLTVFEPGPPAAEFKAGGLKYLHRTDEMARMLHDLGVVFTNYTVNGGILLHGKVEQYPKCFQKMDPERAKRIQHDHWRKTRRIEPGEMANRSMNDPEASGPRKAMRCDFGELVGKLTHRLNIVKQPITSIKPGRVVVKDGGWWTYDKLIVTIPLWILRRIAYFRVPETLAMRLNIITVEPKRDNFVRWDYVYTPYTPEGVIHRISPRDSAYSCEFNGEWTPELNDRVMSDLNFLFPDGWVVQDVKKNLNGHLLPMSEPVEWPPDVAPLGRFTKWNPRATSEVTLSDAFELAASWGLRRLA